MEDEDRKLLHKLLHISESNNRILRRIRREMILVRVLHMAHWFIILGIGIAAYYFLTPYLSTLIAQFSSVTQ
jgi:hypothetical protein